ncbi:LacI family DNA-binding transcriptional regulator [Streptomyces sp. NPDC093109]|uniref:LacI family DNA-binding transcriptional regulator n=1 Tax=Streptomyces sp. NPDC093109 TaxID=3154977 RepID=UPI00344FE6CF
MTASEFKRISAAPGGPATVKQVAARAGVSPATVSRVLAGNYPVATGTRRRVLRVVRELHYVANSHARALRGSGAPQIGFVLGDVLGQPFALAATGAEREAAARGHLCVVGLSGHRPDREPAVVQSMREQGAAAVILIGGVVEDARYRDRMAEVAHGLEAAGSRLVLCGRPLPGPELPATVVEYDNEGGAYAATSHLLARGHRAILYLGGDPAHTTTAGRTAGYRRALADSVGPGAELIERVEFARRPVRDRVARLLREGPPFTAVFGETDVVASAAMAAILDAGLRVPEDISVLGYDDSELAQDLRPALTTVRVPYEEMGRLAVRLALGLRNGEHSADEQRQLLGTGLVPRETVAPASR